MHDLWIIGISEHTPFELVPRQWPLLPKLVCGESVVVRLEVLRNQGESRVPTIFLMAVQHWSKALSFHFLQRIL